MSDTSNSERTPPLEKSPVNQRPEIDISKLPSLPPSGSKAWRGSRNNSGRWRAVGCGCALVILTVVILGAYQGLRGRVWSTYEEIRLGLERSILVEVGPTEKQRLLENLERFGTQVSKLHDPYPAIGRFVAAGREVLSDFVVDPEEAERLNRLLEDELSAVSAEGLNR